MDIADEGCYYKKLEAINIMTRLPDIYYHGTISTHVPSLMEGIMLDKNKGRPDFGKGFYLTSNLIEDNCSAKKCYRRPFGVGATDL